MQNPSDRELLEAVHHNILVVNKRIDDHKCRMALAFGGGVVSTVIVFFVFDLFLAVLITMLSLVAKFLSAYIPW